MPRAAQCWSPICLLLTLVMTPAPARATDVPSVAALERAGLRSQWWGRAIIDSSQDELEYIVPDERRLYAQSRSGLLTAFDAETGNVEWSVLLGSPGVNAMAPVANEQEVIVAVGLKLISVDKQTGEVRWQLAAPGFPSCRIELDDRKMYLGTVDGSVYAYDLAAIRDLFREHKLPDFTHLAQQWRYQTPAEILHIVSDGRLVHFVSVTGGLYCVEAGGRRLKFQIETNAPISTEIGRGADSVVIASQDALTTSLNALTGGTRWLYASGSGIDAAPRVLNGSIYLTARRRGMVRLDEIDGAERWRQPRASQFVSLSSSRVYATDRQGALLALDVASGGVVGQVPFRQFSIVCSNAQTDRIFAATTDGLVICLREQGQSFPLHHQAPEKRPIMPEFAPEEGEQSLEESAEEADTTN